MELSNSFTQRPKTSIKKLLHHQLFKKSSAVTPSRPPIHRTIKNHSHTTSRFQRIKGSNFVREINPIPERTVQPDLSNNYEMTIFHDDQLDDDTQIVLYRRQSKKAPQWARKSQFQLALINQMYFNDKNPEDIFGSVRIDLAHEMVQSIKLKTIELPFSYSSSMCPRNFV